jgi:hypothetical protein
MANTMTRTTQKRRYIRRKKRKYTKRTGTTVTVMHLTAKEMAAFKLGMQVGKAL